MESYRKLEDYFIKLIHENKDEMSSMKFNINISRIVSLAKRVNYKLTTLKLRIYQSIKPQDEILCKTSLEGIA